MTVNIQQPDRTDLTVGSTFTLDYVVSPAELNAKINAGWSSNSSVLAYDTNTNTVTVVGTGTATITVQFYADNWKYQYTAEITITVPDNDTDIILGDVNGDKKVDSSDAALILRHYAAVQGNKSDGRLTAEGLAAADYNGDNKIDSSDAALILQAYAKQQAG